MAGKIGLKWGTIKWWEGLDEVAVAALQKYTDLGMSMSAMMQVKSPEHIDALCNLIDVVDEPIENNWTGEDMTREAAKHYVRTYGL